MKLAIASRYNSVVAVGSGWANVVASASAYLLWSKHSFK